MKNCFLLFIALYLMTSHQFFSQTSDYSPTYGPTKVSIPNSNSSVIIPDGFLFLESYDANQLMREIGNSGMDISGLVMPSSEDADWFVYFKFNDLGYFKMGDVQEELEDIDILEEIKKNTEEQNKKRISSGFSSIDVIGYVEKLYLNKSNQTLNFSIESIQEGLSMVEHRSLYFGRKGLLLSGFVCSKEKYENIKNASYPIRSTVNFDNNYRYADFNPDIDKYAAVGIGTVLVGRQVAKSGWFTKLVKSLGKAIWAFIVGIFAAIWGFIKKIFGKKNSKIDEPLITTTQNKNDTSI